MFEFLEKFAAPFAALDLLSGFLIVFGPTIPKGFLIAVGIYLIAKGGFYFITKRLVSGFDILVGIYALMIANMGFYHLFLSVLSLIYLSTKSLVGIH